MAQMEVGMDQEVVAGLTAGRLQMEQFLHLFFERAGYSKCFMPIGGRA